jgi:riboflavin kinase / FMN adenylyltransferase
MIIVRSIDELPGMLPNAVVTIGNFDGVHRGHRELLRTLKAAAAELGGVSVVVTFEPHPLKVLAPEREFRLITTYREKERLLAESATDYLVVLPFSPDFAAIPAESFVRDLLVGRVGMKRLVIGFDYAFGRNREGNVGLLRRLGTELGFAVQVLDQVGDGETGFSSSVVRELISRGDVRGVVPLLGRHFSVGGTVVHGFHRGKGLGFPTANVAAEEELLPSPGVYAVKVEGDGWVRDGACNVGANPTFRASQITVEVHLLDFDADLYGSRLRVYFMDRIREEQAFADLSALQAAIHADVLRCRDLLRDAVLIRYHE